MSSKVIRQILQTLEDGVNSRPSAIEFGIAYQARVAIDRTRFAIKHTEEFLPCADQTREAGLQLLDALERLETVDRWFKERSRTGIGWGQTHAALGHAVVNGTGRSSQHEPAKPKSA